MSELETISELFVAWDDALTDIEDNVAKLERSRGLKFIMQ